MVGGCVFDHARRGRVLEPNHQKTKHLMFGLGHIVDWGDQVTLCGVTGTPPVIS